MAGVSFSPWHPDLRLGLLLVVAALLLNVGSSGTFGAETFSGQLDLTSVQYGVLAAAGVLGRLSVVAAAIWVDRGPPRGLMAAGAVLLALGPFLTLSDSFALAVTRNFFTGVGGAFVGPLIFYAVAVKRAAKSGLFLGVFRTGFVFVGFYSIIRAKPRWGLILTTEPGLCSGPRCPAPDPLKDTTNI